MTEHNENSLLFEKAILYLDEITGPRLVRTDLRYGNILRRSLKNRKYDGQRDIFAIDKEFFRRNTPVFQGKILQYIVKRAAVPAY